MSLNDVEQYSIVYNGETVSTKVEPYRPGYIDARSNSIFSTRCYEQYNVPACASGFENRPTVNSCIGLAESQTSVANQHLTCTRKAGLTSAPCSNATNNWVKLCRRRFPSGYTTRLAGLTQHTLPFEQTLCDKCCLQTNATTRNTNGCPISYYPAVALDTSCYANNLAICNLEGVESSRCRVATLSPDDYTTTLKQYCITAATDTRVKCAECITYYHQNADPDVATFLHAFCANKTASAEYDLICGCFYTQEYYDILFASLISQYQLYGQSVVSIDEHPRCWFPNCANGLVQPPFLACTSANIAICIQTITIGDTAADIVIDITNDCSLLQEIADPPPADPDGWLLDQTGYLFKYSDEDVKYYQLPDYSMMFYIRPDTSADKQEVLAFGDLLDPDYLWLANHDTGWYETTNADTGVTYFYSPLEGTWYIDPVTGARVTVSAVGETTPDDDLLVLVLTITSVVIVGAIAILVVIYTRKNFTKKQNKTVKHPERADEKYLIVQKN